MRIGNREFDTANHTYVMGILNVTPDSFSDGGRYNQPERALFRVREMIEQGADIIDIGGESTRPGYTPLTAREEMERVIPVIEMVRKEFDIPISLDTSKAVVAQEGIAAGADLINDIWGLKKDDGMAKVIADSGVCCCLMHNRRESVYSDFLNDVIADLEESLELAQVAGIACDKIIVDPGIGFAKNYEQNLQMLCNLDKLHTFGLPILLAASRKSVIGQTLDLEKEERLEGTLATSVIGVMKGCSFVRVHDIRENVRAVKMALAVRELK
ncbi:MAG: dihydropteroate synthase [Lachnospiraceae bacterium]|nr:dihydropteroate synthase [Lachnospiraceae bacterium]